MGEHSFFERLAGALSALRQVSASVWIPKEAERRAHLGKFNTIGPRHRPYEIASFTFGIRPLLLY